MKRCEWAANSLLERYHDHEWGVPLHNDKKLFEFLILDGAQAGLTWALILKRRKEYQKAFSNFQPEKIISYSKKDVNSLLKNKGIIRNKMKIESVINNAKKFLQVKDEFGSFNKYIWSFVGNKTITNSYKKWREIPAYSEESKKMSIDLKNKGFTFVGPTICYAFMQSSGMVNDHITSCFRYKQVAKTIF
tara:strand:+ start:251 stop:820 length:570 start_codon:yes stop_codon:yes gene_type:complete